MKAWSRGFLVAAAAMVASAGIFWLQVRRFSSGMAMTGSGGIGAVSAPLKAGVFPLAPLYETSLLGFVPGRFLSQTSLPPRPPAADTVFASRKLIRTAELSVEIDRYEEAAESVGVTARELGGYVAEVRSARSEGKWHGALVIRFPADRFDEAIRRLGRLGKTLSQSVATQDVTKKVMDLESRIRVKRDAEARMRDVLRSRPAKLSDIVAAEQELTRLVEEIEQMEGERRFLDQQVAYSSVSVTLSEPGMALAVARPAVLAPVWQAFRDAGGALASSIAGLIYTVVVGAPWALLAVLLWSLLRRVRARRLAARQA
jgi:primosomal protein N''